MRYTQLVFSPTGGVRKAAGLLSAAISDRFETIDLSLTLNGQKSARFSKEDVCLIAVPCFGGRVPEIALTRLAQTSGGGAHTAIGRMGIRFPNCGMRRAKRDISPLRLSALSLSTASSPRLPPEDRMTRMREGWRSSAR